MKFILSLLLVVCVTTQVVLYSVQEAPYARANTEAWQTMLQPNVEDVAVLDYGYTYRYYMYHKETLLDSIQQIAKVYYSLPNTTVDYYEYFATPEGRPEPLVVRVSRFEAGMRIFFLENDYDDHKVSEEYTIDNATDLFPFSDSNANVSDLIHTLDEMEVVFRVKNFLLGPSGRVCWEWDVTAHYSMASRGRMVMDVHTDKGLCELEQTVHWYNRQHPGLVVLYFFIIFFSCMSQLLQFRAILRSVNVYHQLKTSDRHHFRNLSCRDKLKFFNLWFIFTTIANTCNVIGAGMSVDAILNVNQPGYVRFLFVGLGAMFTWVQVVQYFETTTSYYVLVSTLLRGAPRVARFLVGVFPVFFGYAMFGVSYFSGVSLNFASVDSACVTLFSLLNGDAIHDTFDEIYPSSPFVSRVYLYTFISLFIYAVLNIFIAIIEDAFFLAKAFQSASAKEQNKLSTADPLTLLETSLPHDAFPVSDSGSPTILDAGAAEPLIQQTHRASDADSLPGSSLPVAASPLEKLSQRPQLAGAPAPAPQPLPHGGTAAGYVPPSPAPSTGAPVAAAAGPRVSFAAPSPSASRAMMSRQSVALVGLPGAGAVSAVDRGLRNVVSALMEVQADYASELEQTLRQSLSDAIAKERRVEAVREALTTSATAAPEPGALPQSFGGRSSPLPALDDSHRPAAPPPQQQQGRSYLAAALARPPHDVSYYPCGLSDCVYCKVRGVFVEALQRTRTEIARAVEGFLAEERVRRATRAADDEKEAEAEAEAAAAAAAAAAHESDEAKEAAPQRELRAMAGGGGGGDEGDDAPLLTSKRLRASQYERGQQ
jgi:hypothetical protein